MKNESTSVAEKNIRTISKREKAESEKAPLSHKIVHRIADFSGTVLFAGINATIFIAWICINVFTSWKFDPFPFTLLTLAVSLESIFLSTFVLLSQNELAKQSDARNKLDLQVNLLAEKESTAIINTLIEIAKKMNIDQAKIMEMETMADDMNPEEVLEKINEVDKEGT